MADNLKFSNAAFATHGMLPLEDDEVTALWGRRAANAAARAYGEWSTIVIGTSNAPERGAATVYFDNLGFTQLPTLDVYQVRGGTELWRVPKAHGESYGDAIPNGFTAEFYDILANRTGRSFFIFNIFPDWHRDGAFDDFPVASMAQFGTFVYRVRGN